LSTKRVISPAEAAQASHPQAIQQGAKRNQGSSVGLRVDLAPGAIQDATVQRTVKTHPVARAAKVFDWVVLLLLCIGLAFAIAALATLLKTVHIPR
jgi:hypothetical protein